MRIDGGSTRGLACVILFIVGCTSSNEQLIAQLGEPDPKTRIAAARALGAQQDDMARIVPALAGATQDADVEVRETSLTALGRIGPAAKSSLPSLEQSLDDPELSVRVAAALASQKIDPGNATFVPVILDALRAGHGPVFLEVERMGPKAAWAVPTLVKLLADERASIRALAARTLGEIGVAEGGVKSALERGLRDNSFAVRKAAQRSLQQIPSQPSAVAH